MTTTNIDAGKPLTPKTIIEYREVDGEKTIIITQIAADGTGTKKHGSDQDTIDELKTIVAAL